MSKRTNVVSYDSIVPDTVTELQNMVAPTGEIRDVVSIISNSLQNSNVRSDIVDEFNNDPYIDRIRDKSEVTQRYAINRYFTAWFTSYIDADTRVYRAGLIHDGSLEEWVSAFEEIVIPGIRLISENNELYSNTLLPGSK